MSHDVRTKCGGLIIVAMAPMMLLALSCNDAWAAKKKPGGGGGTPPDPGFRYERVMLSVSGAAFSDAMSINDWGDVVGRAENPIGAYLPLWWRCDGPGTYTPIVLSSGDTRYMLTEAVDINNNQQIIGQCYDWETYDEINQTMDEHGFLLDAVTGEIEYIKRGPGETKLVAINESGDVLGYFGRDGRTYGFVWVDGQHSEFDFPGAGRPESISNRDDNNLVWIVGSQFRARCDLTSPTPLVGPRTLLATTIGTLMKGGRGTTFGADVNEAGVIVGETDVATDQGQAYRYVPGVGLQGLGTLPGSTNSPDSWATAINELGEIVGGSDLGTSPGKAGFIYVANIMHNLDDWILNLPTQDKGKCLPVDINVNGHICGSAGSEWTQQAFVLIRVPKP